MGQKYKLDTLAKGFLAGFIRDRKLLSKFANKISIFDFDSILPGLNWFVENAVEFWLKYRETPTKEFFINKLNTSNFDETRKTLLVKIIDEIFMMPEKEITYRVDLFKEEMIRLLLKDGLDLASQQLNTSTEKVIATLNSILSDVSLLRTDENIIDFGASFEEREVRRIELKKGGRVLRTGIKDLDSQVRMTYRSVTAFLAPFKRYKSITLTNLGWGALLQGFNVLHVNYEGRVEMWEARYDARFTDIDFEKILFMWRSEEEEERIRRTMERVNSWKQRLFLVRGIPYVDGVNEIKAWIDDIYREKGLYIDVVIIDYFQIMGTALRLGDEEDWKFQHRIAWDLVSLAGYGEHGRIVIGALQTKMSALSVESLRSDQTGRSVAYPQVLDNIIAINQTPDERVEGIIRFSPLIIREGEVRKTDCKVQSELWKIKVAKEMDALWEEVI